ncbi:MAG: sigma-70 family RNA polymerase sigma factor [Firmicutes bacterium]|nr:sigma-70 family RNA polymerase sigma factor [Bacillota bacterium]
MGKSIFTDKNDYEVYGSFLEGDEDALEALVERFGSSLTLYIDGYIHDVHEAEDLMIDLFAYLIAKRPRIREGGVKAYLYKAARNLAIRCAQKRRQNHAFNFEELQSEPESDILVEAVVQTEERNGDIHSRTFLELMEREKR